MTNIIGIRDLSREDIDALISLALRIKNENTVPTIKNKKIATLFFEDSTRTRTSFETAAHDQELYTNGFAGAEGTSVKKGEPVADTVRMFEAYGYNAIVMRHNLEGAARLASDAVSIPVINAGDGSNGHPTQTLLDLMTIKELKGTIDGLKIAIVGDLKYGRTVHSLLQALEEFYVELYLVSPKAVALPEWRIEEFKQHTGRNVIIEESLQKVLPQVDILYMTRVQRERFPKGLDGELEYQKVSGTYKLTASMLSHAKADLKILHPLPRFKNNIEITVDVDKTHHAAYFQQAKNGLYMRQAILQKILNNEIVGQKISGKKEFVLWNNIPISNASKTRENLLYRLDNGTQIDHIEPGKALEICRLLGLDKQMTTTIVPALNIKSSRFGRKDIIAIHNTTLSPEQLFRVALVSKRATINLVQDNLVTKKGKVTLPTIIETLIVCTNKKCVSRKEYFEHVDSKFLVKQQDPLLLRCYFCETILRRDELEFTYEK